MTICLFGNYIKDYPRVQILRQGLRQNGAQILECHTRKTGFKKYLDLYHQHKKVKNKYDFLLVMMGGQTLVWLAKLLSRKKIIFDAFASLYLANVEDRKNCKAKSLKAYYYKFWDWLPCKLADRILLDTSAQIDYFSQKYKVNKNKFIRILTSSDDKIFYPQTRAEEKTDKFIVHWHGHIVPFHSVETIIQAAKILENKTDIEFRIVTRFNSKYNKIKQLAEKLKLNNVKFYSETDYLGLAKYINQADVCLGVFGNNKKAQLVIPNKIIEAVACGKLVITGRQTVLNEVFEDKENIIMVQSENSQELAEKILSLKQDEQFRQKIAGHSYELFQKKMLPQIQVKKLIQILEK